MAQLIIDTGTAANDGTGDPLRTAFTETNTNFTAIYTAGPVDSNVRITDNTILTLNTNGNLVLAPNGVGKVVANVDIVPNSANIKNLGSTSARWNTVYAQYLNVTNSTTFTGDVTVGGNLTVTGDSIELGNIITDALTIQLGNTANTAAAANGAGITVGSNDDLATILYNSSGNVWTTNVGISTAGNVTGGYILGDGSQLTNIPVQPGTYGNANVAAYLPTYTGNVALGNITTGTQSWQFNADGSETFSSATAVSVAAGKLWYDDTTGAWNLGMGGGMITQQVGEELFRYGKASAAITDSPLQLIYKTGSVGASGAITFAPAVAGITVYDQILGCATEDIALNSFGRVTTYGVINGITTNGTAYGEVWADNDDIYYNPVTGGLTKVEPSAPNMKLFVGTVITAGNGASGSFVVKLGVAQNLNSLSDVQITSPTGGQVLTYNQTSGFWDSVGITNGGGISVTAGVGGSLALAVTAAQPTITSVGTLSSLSVAGNVTGAYILGDGSQLTNIPNGVTGNNTEIQYNNSGTLGADAQFTFDSTGGKKLVIGTGGGTIQTNNFVGADSVAAPMLIQSDDGAGSKATHVSFTNASGNITTSFSGIVNSTGNITAPNFIGEVTGNVSGSAATATSATTAGTVTANAQPNITSVGTLTGVTVTGNITGGNLIATGNIVGTTNGFDIGYLEIPQVVLSANVTAALSDSGKHLYSTTAGNLAVTIPSNANVAFPIGSASTIVVQAAGNVIIDKQAGVSLYLAGNSTDAGRVVSTYGMATIMKVGVDTWFISGSGVA